MRSPFRGDRDRRLRQAGSVTAEFAAAMPAVVLVLAGSLAAIQLGSAQLTLQNAASTVSRALGRGAADAVGLADRLVSGVHVHTELRGELVCVTLSRSSPIAALGALRLAASSCALDGGR